MTDTTLRFLGATGTVTGSRFLLDAGGRRLLVDCGLYQGERELRQRNREPFPFEPDVLDAVLLTHAHLDHCGAVPRLVREGFRGPVYATADTLALAKIVLTDSAHLLEQETSYVRKHGYSKHDNPEPLYTAEDVERALGQFRPAPFEQAVPVAPGVEAVFRTAGHILGSSIVEVRVTGSPVLGFSGDLGRQSHPLLRPPAPCPDVDVLVVESTYGNRAHDDVGSLKRAAAAIRRTAGRGGSVLIPAFAVDRTEVLLLALRDMVRDGDIPDLPVFVDSPMALASLDIYRDAITTGSQQLRSEVTAAAFDTRHVTALRTVEESKSVNDPPYPSIIISASGMATGGRVLHHLRFLLPDPRNTVLLVGFAAAGTRARQLAEGARNLKLLGEYVPVRAEIVDAQGFSVHADGDELLDWLKSAPAPPGTTFVVHGEPDASEALCARIGEELGWNAVVPRYGERVRVVRR
ncbi:MAG: MBL fold metallo-hydrolase [Mycobacteriales bacterium]